MRNVGRYVDEIARLRLGHILEALAPAQPCDAADDVDHALEISVVMRTRFRLGFDRDRARPYLACPGALGRHGCAPVHARSLRRVGIELLRANDSHSIMSPPSRSHIRGTYRVLSMLAAREMGTAKFEPEKSDRMAKLTPITFPLASKTGPPDPP